MSKQEALFSTLFVSMTKLAETLHERLDALVDAHPDDMLLEVRVRGLRTEIEEMFDFFLESSKDSISMELIEEIHKRLEDAKSIPIARRT